MTRVVLGSASTGRLSVLRSAGDETALKLRRDTPNVIVECRDPRAVRGCVPVFGAELIERALLCIDRNESAIDEAAETAAIMKVIENETKCFFDGNYECWASNWSHENYVMQAWNNDDGTFDAAIGWEKINAQGKDWIEKYYKNGKDIIHPVVKKEKPLVKFFNEKTAYLSWK